MLRSLKSLEGYRLDATDGKLGECSDFLVDEQTWTVRYMVADTRRWLPGRKVVVSPIALGEPDWERNLLPVKLTKEQIKAAPELDERAPVTREYEIWYHKHYGWPYYWSGTGLWASAVQPRTLWVPPSEEARAQAEVPDEPEFDRPHLHSAEEMTGYRIRAEDGEIGHLDDFIIDDENWSVRYGVLATRNWLPGKRVLVPMNRLEDVVWEDRAIRTDLTRDQIKESPQYDPGTPINRKFEERVYDFLGRPHQWS